MAQQTDSNPWVQPVGSLAIGCLTVALVFGLQWASRPAGTGVGESPRTGALTLESDEFIARLRSDHSGYCLDTNLYSQLAGEPASLRNCASGSLQRLTFEEVPDTDTFRIRRSYDGKCLEANSDTNVGTRATFWPCHQGDSERPGVADDAQLWVLNGDTGTDYRVVSASTNEALVIQGASYAANAQLTLRSATGASDEYWQFEQRVDSETDPSSVGQWGPLISWPFVPVHAAVLPDNKLLTWASNEKDSFTLVNRKGTFTSIYDLDTGQFTSADVPEHDMFCSGTVQLADGRILASGGNPSNNAKTSIFDPATSSWTQMEDMAYPRWYGTSLLLADGDVMTTFAKNAEITPERYSDGSGWSELPGASMLNLRTEQNAANAVEQFNVVPLQWYAFMHTAPDGRVFHSGPTTSMHWFDPAGVGSVQPTGLSHSRNRQFGSSVMYRPGQLLITGGADPIRADTVGEFGNALGGTDTAVTVDISGAAPVLASTDSMIHMRVNHNAVVMPNGEVLVVGGEAWGRVFSDRYPVFESEIWNPDNGEWRAADSVSTPRTYHSWAVLLQDATVIAGGGGLCGNCGVNHRTAQIYSPPYLYAGDGSAAQRPMLGALASNMHAGEAVFASALSGSDNLNFSLVRASSVTHSINTDQRWIPVDADEIEAGLFSVSLPTNPNVLLPGNYWLFAYDTDGVPSVGHPVLIEPGTREFNSPPVVPTLSTIEISGAADVDHDIIAYDPDGQGMLFTVDSLPPGLALDRATGRLSGDLQTASWPDSQITVSDGDNEVSGVVQWKITAGPKQTYTTGSMTWLVLLLLIPAWARRHAAQRHKPVAC